MFQSTRNKMNLAQLQKRALEIRKKYEELETKKYGKAWTNAQLVEGLGKDVNDLLSSVNTDRNVEKVSHELSDCLWSILVLAKKYNIDLESSFFKTMDEIEQKIDSENKF